KEFPRRFAEECFDASVRDNKDYAKAAAAKLRSYSATKGDNTIKFTYIGADGKEHTEVNARSFAADLIENLGYTSLTVNDVINNYGSVATFEYHSNYTVTVEVNSN
ncbi:MAG: hypothetical protein IJ736_12760, partial [Firmicutes bacterium]|nr:hypothetical protein [Bacillota bacterium]